MFGMGPTELIIVGIIAVLLFGRKLPEVAKSLGVSYREFRKGLNELQSQVNTREIYNSVTATPSYKTYSETTAKSASTSGEVDDLSEPTAPKFEPPPAEPQAFDDATPSESLPSGEVNKSIDER